MSSENAAVEVAEDITGRRRDQELLAIERCVRILEELAPCARERAVLYLSSRYKTDEAF